MISKRKKPSFVVLREAKKVENSWLEKVTNPDPSWKQTMAKFARSSYSTENEAKLILRDPENRIFELSFWHEVNRL